MPGPRRNATFPSNGSFNYQETDDALHKGLKASILALMMLVIIIGNVLVLLVLYRQRKQANLRVTNMFLANLAVVDMSVGMLILPVSIYTLVSGGWDLGEPVCQMNGFINMTSGGTSILTMAAISIERYFAIVSRPGKKLRTKQALFLLGVVWFCGLLIGLLPVLGWNRYEYGSFGSICKMSFDHDKGYVLFAALVCFALPLVTMVYCYLRVFLKVRSHRKQMQQWQRPSDFHTKENQSMKCEMRTAKIVLTVLLVFAGAWTPFVMVHLLQLSPSVDLPPGVFLLVTSIAGMHSFCNPIIYTAMNRKFRTDLLNLLPVLKRCARCCSVCCGQRDNNKVEDFVIEPTRPGLGSKSPLTDPIAVEMMQPL